MGACSAIPQTNILEDIKRFLVIPSKSAAYFAIEK